VLIAKCNSAVSDANVDHLVIGPTGLFVIDYKQWTGSVHQGADGTVWHHHYRLDRTGDGPLGGPYAGWAAQHPGGRAAMRPGCHVQGGGMQAQGVAIVRAHLLRSALGYDKVLSDADVEFLATP
jgi:hypothetical protein